jgi:uncharacterized protein YecA (UPF0149 family)
MPVGQVPTDLGLTDSRKVINTAARSTQTVGSATEEDGRMNDEEFNALIEEASSFCKTAQATPATAVKTAASSFCKTPATPRNAQCPCGSGVKYKRCCGKNAPPVLNMGA